MSQEKQILDYLKLGYSITPIEALQMFGSLRLAARISRLREEGIPIITETVRDGKKSYARYSIA